ncbi:hypothetical protein BH11PSE11_BH11PSE11_18670 [soil metagenome]
MKPTPPLKLAAIAAISGAILLLAGTMLHPMHADPNAALAAFTEYAADKSWLASHLTQLAGMALMTAALVLLSRRLAGGRADAWAALGSLGATAGLAVAATLQAVDGVALKAMLEAWGAAAGRDREMLFHAAFAVRQIEIGLAAVTCMIVGITVSIYGIAIMSDRLLPAWMGVLALLAGIPTGVAGVVIAYTGFSATAMLINMPANILLLIWMLLLGVLMWRQPSAIPPVA